MRATVLIAGGCFFLGAAAATYVQGLRWDNHVAELKLEQSDLRIKGAHDTIELFSEFGQNFADALQDAEYKRGLNEKSQKELADALRSLRTDVGRVRGDVADVSRRVESASSAARAEYATTCAAVFADVVEAGGELAERGAEIAAKAEGHAVDADTAVKAWPKRSPH